MRLAIRSGWNCSKSVTFSPVDANIIGLPVTEATEPPTEWAPAYAETEPPQDSDDSGYEEDYDGYDSYADAAQQPTDLNAIKIDKSISNKTYTTDNTAGIVSWICVGVGLIVMLVMLLSTKLTGKTAGREP